MTAVADPTRIRVAYLIDTLEVGGAEKQLLTIATGVSRERFAPSVLCLTRRGLLEAEVEQAGVPVHLVGKRHKAGVLAYRRLRAWLRAERPHVLHTWMFTCNLYGRLAARGLPVRTLASEVSADPGKSRLRLAVDRMLAPSTDAFYVNSREVARFYHERCAIPLERIAVIPNGVDVRPVEPVSRASLGVPGGAYLVCCAGRLSTEKGFEQVIEALTLGRLSREDVYLTIAGEGPERPALEALAARRGVARRVRLLGYRGDLPRVIQAADVFVLSSRFEGMSNALMEALALGKPCIATAVGGVDELVVDGECGLVLPRSDAALIAATVERLMATPELAARLGQAARERMARQFSVDANVRRFEELYATLAGLPAAVGARGGT
jgi:glycosyltransferase involved in cell wall biosynthesis